MEELEKGRTFEVKGPTGDIIECETVMTYICDLNSKVYLFYTDNEYDEDGNLNLYASRYLGDENGKLILENIEDEDEWSLLDKALEEAKEGLNE